MNLGVAGKTAVVTGGTSGLGAEIVRLFTAEGIQTVFTGRKKEKGRALEGELTESAGAGAGEAVFVHSDAGRERDITKLAERVKKEFGGCDFLINNAAVLKGGPVHEMDVDEWDAVQNVNMRGVFLTCRYFIPQMLEKGSGSVVNVSSVSGLYGDYEAAAYNTSKGALSNFTRALSLDYARRGIRVNAVCPGSMRTPMYDGVAESIGREKCEELFSKAYPAGRIAEPVEVAKVVLFLISDLAAFVTGVNLPVDGGLSAHTGQPRF